MSGSDGGFYGHPEEFLQQGDLFRVDVVAPVVDRVQRLFRSHDGRHASAVFADGAEGALFDREGLETLLSEIDRQPLHTEPFEETDDGQMEFVVVQASLLRYFVLASQTCDISGMDGPSNPVAVILPVITLRDLCTTERFPFLTSRKGVYDKLTINEYLLRHSGVEEFSEHQDPADYGAALRIVISEWNPPKNTPQKRNLGLIKSFVQNQAKKGWLHWLSDDPSFGVPDACVDLSRIFTVATDQLQELSHARIASLRGPYRDQFSQVLGNHLSRIATPKPIGPPGL